MSEHQQSQARLETQRTSVYVTNEHKELTVADNGDRNELPPVGSTVTQVAYDAQYHFVYLEGHEDAYAATRFLEYR